MTEDKRVFHGEYFDVARMVAMRVANRLELDHGWKAFARVTELDGYFVNGLLLQFMNRGTRIVVEARLSLKALGSYDENELINLMYGEVSGYLESERPG